MSWIKRNLFFFAGTIVAVALMAWGGYFLWSQIQADDKITADTQQAYDEFDKLNKENFSPENLQIAAMNTEKLKAFIAQARGAFRPIEPIPRGPRVDDQAFSRALALTVAELRRDAEASSVTLPTNYNFSFTAQEKLTHFYQGSPGKLATNLAEVKLICGVLFNARINALIHLHRERVSPDDNEPDDIFEGAKTVTIPNVADLTPYQVTFKCFSVELAQVMGGFATCSNCVIIRNITVAPVGVEVSPGGPGNSAGQPTMNNAQPQPAGQVDLSTAEILQARAIGLSPEQARAMKAARNGGGAGQPTMSAAQNNTAQSYSSPTRGPGPSKTPNKNGFTTFLEEQPLQVEMVLDVVKLKPQK